jgi:hypothetical protein
MPEDKWLERASAMVGGIFECTRNLDVWKHWEWDADKSDEANSAEVRALHLNFVNSFELIVAAVNRWQALPHPPVTSVRRRARQWGVLNISLKAMIASIDYEYTAFSLARFGDEEEKEIGVKAAGSGVVLFDAIRLGLDQTIAGRVVSFDGVTTWANFIMKDRKELDAFSDEYAMRGAELRVRAGLGLPKSTDQGHSEAQ